MNKTTTHLKPLIQMTNLVKSYALEEVRSTVLNNVSLNISSGDLLAIVGASGSGKSTLMNLIGLLDKPDSGTYYLNNQEVSSLSNDDRANLRNHNIGFIFQQFNLLPRFTALQNVILPLSYRNIPLEEQEERARIALNKVGMLPYIRHKPMQLSGGQQQRVAIARALVTEPQVLLADEPTGALDSRTGAEVMHLFLTLHAEGRTLILVTHDRHIATQCDRTISLLDGQIIAESES